MENILFETLCQFLKKQSNIEELAQKSRIQRIKMECDLEKAERVMPCKNCDRMIPAIDYVYEIFKSQDASHYPISHTYEESTFLRYRCPYCQAVQETELIKTEFIT